MSNTDTSKDLGKGSAGAPAPRFFQSKNVEEKTQVKMITAKTKKLQGQLIIYLVS